MRRRSLESLVMTYRKEVASDIDLPVVLHAISLHTDLRRLYLLRVKVGELKAETLALLGACSSLELLGLVVRAEALEVTDGDVDALLKRLAGVKQLFSV